MMLFSLRKKPTVIIQPGFYVSVCLWIVCVGYSARFFIAVDSTLCKKDGTMRQGEPNAEKNFACLTAFTACYYFLFAALIWIVVMLRLMRIHSTLFISRRYR